VQNASLLFAVIAKKISAKIYFANSTLLCCSGRSHKRQRSKETMSQPKISPEDLAKRLGLSDSITSLKNGEVVTKELDASTDKDLSLVVAALLDADIEKLWEFANAERVHELQDATLSTGIIDPANPSAGLEAMKLTEDMVDKLMKTPFLSKDETLRVKDGLKHGKGAHVYKEILAERALAYWNKGLEGIVPYEGKGRDPKADLKAATKVALELVLDPTTREELTVIPAKSAHPEAHKLTWTIQQGNAIAAPTLNHLFRHKDERGLLSVTNQFYSGQDKDSLQILAGVVPTSDGRSALFYTNHTYSSAVAGFGGGAKRGIGRKVMKGKIVDTFKKAQALKL
jgi:hypothetical protein